MDCLETLYRICDNWSTKHIINEDPFVNVMTRAAYDSQIHKLFTIGDPVRVELGKIQGPSSAKTIVSRRKLWHLLPIHCSCPLLLYTRKDNICFRNHISRPTYRLVDVLFLFPLAIMKIFQFSIEVFQCYYFACLNTQTQAETYS